MKTWGFTITWYWSLCLIAGLVILIFSFKTAQPVGHERSQPEVPHSASTTNGPVNFTERIDQHSQTTRDKVIAAANNSQTYGLSLSGGYVPMLSDGRIADDGWFDNASISDVTGDGRNDLIVTGRASLGSTEETQLTIFPQLRNGSLGNPKTYLIDPFVSGITIADMNNDRVPDILLTAYTSIKLAISDGKGGLNFYDVGSTAAEELWMDVNVVTLDLNQDGNQDVVAHLKVTGSGISDSSVDRRSRFRVFYGDGQGGIVSHKDLAIFGQDSGDYGDFDVESATSLVAEDINRDGFTDLAMASRRFVFADQENPPFLSIYTNNRNGGFHAPKLIKANFDDGDADAGYVAVENLSLGDFNHDSRLDLAGTTYSTSRSRVYVFLQSASGNFSSNYSFKKDALPNVIPILGVDLNGDGLDDLITGHDAWGAIGYFIQENGILTDQVQIPVYSFVNTPFASSVQPGAIAVGDINSDGCNDVAYAAGFNGLDIFVGNNCARRRYFTGGPLPAQILK